jgi:hypothetical protein
MGGAVGKFIGGVAKIALKGATSAVLGGIPYVGSTLAGAINGLYAEGTGDLKAGLPANIKLKEGEKGIAINTPAQLKDLVNKFPDQAKKAGLTIEKIDEGVERAKEVSKAVGGKIKIPKDRPVSMRLKDQVVDDLPVSKAVGGKVKKARTPAQLEATKKLVEANRKRRAKK